MTLITEYPRHTEYTRYPSHPAAGTGIAVYGASSNRIPAPVLEAARTVGALIARAGVPLVCGGGNGGVMAAAIEGAAQAGGTTIGVLPRFMMDRDWNHPMLTETVVTEDMHSRKRVMAELSRGAIAMPGGIGTFDELFEIMTRRQLKLYRGPLVLCNIDGYYDPIIQMLHSAESLGYMRPGQPAKLIHIAADASEAVRQALEL